MAEEEVQTEEAEQAATNEQTEQTEQATQEGTEKKDQTPTREEFEQLKKTQAGQDRENQRLRKENEELKKQKEEAEKEKMTEAEKAQYELEQLKEENAKTAFNNKKLGKISELGLPNELNEVIDNLYEAMSGRDEETFAQAASALNDLISSQADERGKAWMEQEVNRRFGDKQVPKSGEKKGEISYEEYTQLSDAEQQQYSPQETLEIINKAKNNKE